MTYIVESEDWKNRSEYVLMVTKTDEGETTGAGTERADNPIVRTDYVGVGGGAKTIEYNIRTDTYKNGERREEKVAGTMK